MMIRTCVLWLLILCYIPFISACSASEQVASVRQQPLLGLPVYIQIFKQERKLELYVKQGQQYQLVKAFPICNFSGGLGPKKLEGDLKSPEGFYQVGMHSLKPNSKYYRAINIGFPNSYDRAHNYTGDYLMIHGACRSIGCYAMTNEYMDEIYRYVEAAFLDGQQQVDISIYPFRMTEQNLKYHRDSAYISFWRQLKPAYDYFIKYHQPPSINVINGQYVLQSPNPDRESNTKLVSVAH